MKERIEKVSASLLQAAEAALITTQPNRFYLLGLDTADAGTLLLTKEKAFFFIDSRYTEIAEKTVKGALVVEQKNLMQQLYELLQRTGIKELYLEDEAPLSLWRSLSKAMPDISFNTNGALTQVLSLQRMVKDRGEVQQIRSAQEITDATFNYMLTRIAPGRKERDLALELDTFMKKAGSDGLAFDTICIAGKNTSLPHGVPGDYIVQKGDFVTMDFGAKWKGYCTDMTRTVVAGNASEEQKHVYDTVFAAQAAGLAAVHAGVRGCDVDAVSRTLIDRAGYKGCFGHGLGHSVGVEIHENPRFSPLCDMIVPAGAIMTVEPGIYLPGKFGVRIEDSVLVTEKGCENLAHSPKNLIELS